MSSGVPHTQHYRNGSLSRMADPREVQPLPPPHVQNGVPRHRESIVSQDTASRHQATHDNIRNESQSHDTYHPTSSSNRGHDSYPEPSQHQFVAGPSRKYHVLPLQHMDPTNPQHSQHNPHQRHPNLILDTRNLPNPRPSINTPSHTTHPQNISPSTSSEYQSVNLHEDLTSLKSSLETLWNQSSKRLHGLHSIIVSQAEALHSLGTTKANLESTLAQHQATLSQELERLSVENSRLIKDIRDADESRKRALREREMLSEANARLWEDKARLEGEKRELRVKLDTETEFANLCRLELDKRKVSSLDSGVKVKMEEDDERHSNDGQEGIHVPLTRVEDIIEKRLRTQAVEFTRAAEEVYARLAQSQTSVTELQAQLKRYSTSTHAGGTTAITPQPPPHPNRRSNESITEKTPPVYSPVTPHTAFPSAISENDREYPAIRMSSSRKGSMSNYQANPSSVFVRHGDNRPVPPVGRRESEVGQRPVTGSMAHKPSEGDVRARRVSVPSLQGASLRSAAVSLVHGPTLDSARDSERGGDAKGQTASTYAGSGAGAGAGAGSGAGSGAGWRPTALPIASTSRSQATESHSRPVTPDRPFKRARTDDEPDATSQSHVSPTDDRMITSSPEGISAPSEMLQRLEQEETGRDMTDDELLMFRSLSRVLVKKRDNDGWKCVLCRQEKKSPTQTFSETTPIGVVTHHVKEVHGQFWKELKDDGEKIVTPAR